MFHSNLAGIYAAYTQLERSSEQWNRRIADELQKDRFYKVGGRPVTDPLRLLLEYGQSSLLPLEILGDLISGTFRNTDPVEFSQYDNVPKLVDEVLGATASTVLGMLVSQLEPRHVMLVTIWAYKQNFDTRTLVAKKFVSWMKSESWTIQTTVASAFALLSPVLVDEQVECAFDAIMHALGTKDVDVCIEAIYSLHVQFHLFSDFQQGQLCDELMSMIDKSLYGRVSRIASEVLGTVVKYTTAQRQNDIYVYLRGRLLDSRTKCQYSSYGLSRLILRKSTQEKMHLEGILLNLARSEAESWPFKLSCLVALGRTGHLTTASGQILLEDTITSVLEKADGLQLRTYCDELSDFFPELAQDIRERLSDKIFEKLHEAWDGPQLYSLSCALLALGIDGAPDELTPELHSKYSSLSHNEHNSQILLSDSEESMLNISWLLSEWGTNLDAGIVGELIETLSKGVESDKEGAAIDSAYGLARLVRRLGNQALPAAKKLKDYYYSDTRECMRVIPALRYLGDHGGDRLVDWKNLNG